MNENMGAIVSEGAGHVALAVVRSLGRKGIETTVTSSDPRALTFYSKYCTRRISPEPQLDFFLSLGEEDVVMPMDEDLMLNLTRHRRACRCALPFPDHEILERVVQKDRLIAHAQEIGIPCPRTVFLDGGHPPSDLVRELSFPVVIKPARSFGGRGITFVHSGEALEEAIGGVTSAFGRVFLQERIPVSTKYTAGCLCNADGELRRICILRELRNYPLETGPASCVETVEHPEILSHCEELLSSLRFSGIADVDFVEDRRDGRPRLMEINPRFWGSLSGAIRAGVDFPHLLYRMAHEGDVERSLEYRRGVRARNVIFSDLKYLKAMMLQDLTPGNIAMVLREVVSFRKDDAYYYFDIDDLQPFIRFFMEKMRVYLKTIGRFRGH